ncbi:sensor histidine kinase [Fulvivirga sp. M361]|uniref:sensor histidine kinase n=1 Tax=Fulvivirga sp. M361 TaxID=2594266 RepID=UPI00117A6FF7|nr:tetratricopeptide repeat-containing sensor histidine kinase [Fulvivirga sp. M361]TRX59501.1 sensor histidine kinase [Fulvivirga sp. M361]
MKQSYFIFLLSSYFLIFSGDLGAQQLTEIADLRKKLETANDTTLAGIYFELSMKYQHMKPDSAMYFAEEAIVHSRTINYQKGEADGLISLGRLKRDKGAYAEALDDLFMSLKIFRDIKDKKQIANALNDISIVYAISEDYEQSLDFFKQALTMFQELGDEKGESYALNNIGIIYQEMGLDSTARDYFLQSLHIKEKNNDGYGISRAYSNLASIMEEYELYDEALLYYFKADSVYQTQFDLRGEADNYISIANLYHLMNAHDLALKYGLKGLELSYEINLPPIRQDALQVLTIIYESLGNYKEALKYQRSYQYLTDSLLNVVSLENVERLKEKFNTEEKEREIIALKKNQELQQALVERRTIQGYLLIGCVMLLLLSSVFLYIAYSAGRKKKNTLLKMNRDKDRFLSILSHDIKSPLNTLKGFSHLLSSSVDHLSQDEIKTFGNRINSSLNKLTQLIDNLLEWSMVRTNVSEMHFDKIDMKELIQDVVELYQLTAEHKKIEIVTDASSDAFGYADYNSIHTVLRNLLSNGIKFSHPDSKIMIKTESDKGQVRTSVKDFGVGIGKEVLNRLFSLTKDKVRNGTADEKGTGLGLALSKELILENNGELNVMSQPGQGSEFSFLIPAYQ